jgi:hypothetical protein
MVRARIVEIDGAFDETQTEKLDIKIEIPLWIAGDGSDVMKPRNFALREGVRAFAHKIARKRRIWPGATSSRTNAFSFRI